MIKVRTLVSFGIFFLLSIALCAQNFISKEEAIPILKQHLYELDSEITSNPMPKAMSLSGEAGPGILPGARYEFGSLLLNDLSSTNHSVAESIDIVAAEFNEKFSYLKKVQRDEIKQEYTEILIEQ